jgi:hypothetical protein
MGGAALLAAAFRHFSRASAPMLSLTSLRVATFRITVFGGTLARMAIGAAPFLLVLALTVLASLVGIARLPHDAGNHFIDRGDVSHARKAP